MRTVCQLQYDSCFPPLLSSLPCRPWHRYFPHFSPLLPPCPVLPSPAPVPPAAGPGCSAPGRAAGPAPGTGGPGSAAPPGWRGGPPPRQHTWGGVGGSGRVVGWGACKSRQITLWVTPPARLWGDHSHRSIEADKQAWHFSRLHRSPHNKQTPPTHPATLPLSSLAAHLASACW
jgi:hypothetical protein